MPATPSGPEVPTPPQIPAAIMAEILSLAKRAEAPWSAEETIVFYDLSRFDQNVAKLISAFPVSTRHTLAVKANPLTEVLRRAARHGLGAETASLGEIQLALEAGIPANNIVFDSPAKTVDELRFALERGVAINANSLAEIERIAALRSEVASSSSIGIRINPGSGGGTIDATSVARQNSKFGVFLDDHAEDLTEVLSRYPWIDTLHVHIGSQGISLPELVEGIGRVYDFLIANRHRFHIEHFNIGGGLPAKYAESDPAIPFNTYVTSLESRCPQLFDDDITLITEFGRALHANCGWVASKVEYLNESDSTISTLVTHVGADMFVRKAYRPEDWHHDLSVCDSAGELREGDAKSYQVAGPLCFAGDLLAADVALPADTRPGDHILIHDTGAYTFSMWSIYNSRQFPSIVGYEDDGRTFQVLRHKQSPEDIVKFWAP